MLSHDINRIDAQRYAATTQQTSASPPSQSKSLRGQQGVPEAASPPPGRPRWIAAAMAWLGRSHSSIAAIAAIAAIVGLLGVVPVAVPLVQHYLGRDLPVQVVLAIDTSTSMRCPVDHSTLGGRCPRRDGSIPRFSGTSRIQAAVTDGVVPAVSYFRRGDSVGVWRFASTVLPGTISPYENAAEIKQKLTPLVRQTGGGTRLYETIREAVLRLRKDWKPRTINALVILTDAGDRGSRLGVERLTKELLDEALGPENPDKPVYVFITAGYDAPGCDALLGGVSAFHHECVTVSKATSVQDAYNRIQRRLDQLAKRSTGPQ